MGLTLDDILGEVRVRGGRKCEWLPSSDEIIKQAERKAAKIVRRFQKPRVSLLKECLKRELALDSPEKIQVGLVNGYFKRNHFIVDSQVEILQAVANHEMHDVFMGDTFDGDLSGFARNMVAVDEKHV